MVYINGEHNKEKETIDEFTTRKEAKQALIEYKLSYPTDFKLWLSQRPCKGWK